MHRFATAVLLSVALGSVHAGTQVPVAAIETVSAYSRAVREADCPEVIRLSGVLARHPEATEDLCATYREWKQRGLVERLRAPTAFLSSGQDRLVVVPNSRIGITNGRPMINNGVYLAYSRDAGQAWKVIDISCDHLQDWVRAVYPAYDGHPAFIASVDRPTANR